MAQTIGGQVGPGSAADNTYPPLYQGRNAELVAQNLHGKFYEQNFRNNVFSTGMTLTSISNATFTTLTASTTPIVGVWNPTTSPVNLVILQAALGVVTTAATATGGGPYVWAYSTGNSAISTGLSPLNRKSLATQGSFAKGFANTALTGLTNNLVVAGAAPLSGGQLQAFSFVATAAGSPAPFITMIDLEEGGWIVPPGGVLALLATTTPVAHSAASMLVWEEVKL